MSHLPKDTAIPSSSNTLMPTSIDKLRLSSRSEPYNGSSNGALESYETFTTSSSQPQGESGSYSNSNPELEMAIGNAPNLVDSATPIDDIFCSNASANSPNSNYKTDKLSPDSDCESEKRFVCQYCHKSFKLSNILKVHARIHTGEKPYVCNFCEKRFNQSGSLNRHLQTHDRRAEAKNNYPCRHCDLVFIHSSQLQEHESQKHTHTAERDNSFASNPKNLPILNKKEEPREPRAGNSELDTVPAGFQSELEVLGRASKNGNFTTLPSPFQPPLGLNFPFLPPPAPANTSFMAENLARSPSISSPDVMHSTHAAFGLMQQMLNLTRTPMPQLPLPLALNNFVRSSGPSGDSKCSQNVLTPQITLTPPATDTLQKNSNSSCNSSDRATSTPSPNASHANGRNRSPNGSSTQWDNYATEDGKHCKACGKQFNCRSAIKIHYRTHTGEKPYQCKYCTKAFSQNGTLKRHKTTCKVARGLARGTELTANHAQTVRSSQSALHPTGLFPPPPPPPPPILPFGLHSLPPTGSEASSALFGLVSHPNLMDAYHRFFHENISATKGLGQREEMEKGDQPEDLSQKGHATQTINGHQFKIMVNRSKEMGDVVDASECSEPHGNEGRTLLVSSGGRSGEPSTSTLLPCESCGSSI